MKEGNTILSINFFLDCEMNVQLNKIKEATEELSLLKHWALNFEKMDIYFKNQVITEINKRANEKDFYDCLAPIKELEE